jgi:methyl-accepting chemotaxis protein
MARVNISTLNITITGNARGLLSATNASRQSINRMARDNQTAAQRLAGSFGEFNKILARTIALYATFRAAGAVGGAIGDSVRLAANAEQTAIGFEVLLGSAEAAKKTIADLYDFVETTPFRLEEVQQSTKLLAAFGFEQEKLQPTLRALGDIASATGQPLKEIADLYGRTRVENRLYTRDLNQFTSRGIDVLGKLAEQFGVNKTEIRAMAEAGTLSFADIERAIASMTARGGQYFQLTQRQAETTAGEYSNFLDEVDALKREFGLGLIPTLSEFLGVLRETVAGTDDAAASLRLAKEAGKSLGEFARSAAGWLAVLNANFVLIDIQVARLLSVFAELAAVIPGLDVTPFTSGFLDNLNRQYEKAIQRADKLLDLNQRLSKATGVNTDGEKSLADLLGNLTDEAIGAKKQLELLEKQAVDTADKIRKEYASPLEKFKDAIRELAQAGISGDLEPEFINRALRDEVDKLRESYKKLKNELKENVAIERGSQEDLEDQFKRRFKEQQDEDAQDLKKLIFDIAKEEKARAENLKASAEQTAVAADRLKDSLDRASKNTAEMADAAKKATENLLANQRKSVRNEDSYRSLKEGSAAFVLGPGFFNAFVAEKGLENGQRLGKSLLGDDRDPGSNVEIGEAIGGAINGYFQRTQTDRERRTDKPDRLREPSNTNRRDTAQRTDKELQRVVASTSQNEVQRLDRIAGAIERAPLQTIEVVEYRA